MRGTGKGGMKRYLAFDLGAGSGRAMLGTIVDGRLELTELARFENRLLTAGGHLRWDVHSLFDRMRGALAACLSGEGPPPSGIGIDTWGVDYGLLDAVGRLLGLPYSYRDRRTENAMEEFQERIARERVYELTGIQFMPFNTLFQLYAEAKSSPSLLDEAADLLFVPDLFNYFLTGVKVSEYTFATTSQLYNPSRDRWEEELFEALGVPIGVMQSVVRPGTVIGETARESGAPGLPVVAVASHDTASAVAAVPAAGEDWAYISSGTWSLVGVETREPIITGDSLRLNFTNEGGFGGTFRFLRNVPGLWFLQRCGTEWAGGGPADHRGLAAMAEAAPPFRAFIDPDHPGLDNPPSMEEAIRGFLKSTGQDDGVGRPVIVRGILEGLALRYAEVIGNLEAATGGTINRVHVVGGGARNAPLNRFTACATGLPVIAGPAEATAAGNVLVQAFAIGDVSSHEELREVVRRSFELDSYEPGDTEEWKRAMERFKEIRWKAAG